MPLTPHRTTIHISTVLIIKLDDGRKLLQDSSRSGHSEFYLPDYPAIHWHTLCYNIFLTIYKGGVMEETPINKR